MFYEPVVFIGAELPDFDYHANVDRTNELRASLLQKGLNIVGVKLNGTQAFMVVTPTYTDLLDLARKLGQSSIFISDKDRQTCQVETSVLQEIKDLGKLCPASNKLEADGKLTISFIEDGKEFFFTTKEL